MTPLDMVIVMLFAGMSMPGILKGDRSCTNAFPGVLADRIDAYTRFQPEAKVRPAVQNSRRHAGRARQPWTVSQGHDEQAFHPGWDIMATVREAGLPDRAEVKYAILEPGGYISAIRE